MIESYFDIDGKPIGLDELCIREPGWAANRIRAMRATIDELTAKIAEPAPYGGAPIYRCTNPKCDWYARLSDVDNNTRCTCGRMVTLPSVEIVPSSPPVPVEWVDGRATVGDVTVQCTIGRTAERHAAAVFGDGMVATIEAHDEATAKRIAIAVAREMQR